MVEQVTWGQDYFALHNGFKTETATKKIKRWRKETGTFGTISQDR